MVNKTCLTHNLTFISTIYSLYIFQIFFIVPNDPKFFVGSTLYTMLVCICNKFWVFSKFCVPYSIPPVNNLLSCEQMALANHRAEPHVATSLRSFLSERGVFESGGIHFHPLPPSPSSEEIPPLAWLISRADPFPLLLFPLEFDTFL